MTHPNNTAPCGCDGRGNVYHGEGALTYITPCQDADCQRRRADAWSRECDGLPLSRSDR